eukprot:UN03385
MWDINTSKCIQTLKVETHRSINCLYHNKDANELYCGLDNGHISVWDLTNYKCIITSIKGHMYGVDFITYHNNTNTIVTASEDKSMGVWNARDKTCTSTLRLKAKVKFMDINKSQNRMVIYLENNTLEIRDPKRCINVFLS